MKIKLFSFTLALCIVLGGLFASCGKNSTNSKNDTDSATATYSETDKETVRETEADTLETLPEESETDEELRVPIENEKALSFIEFQYEKALEAISFAKGQLPYDNNTEIISEDGIICYPITDIVAREELEGGAIESFEDLTEYLRSIFALSIADSFIDIARDFYKDADGLLCFKTDRIADGFEIETEETQKESEPSTEEEPSAPVVASKEFFLSDFTEKLFRYTAKINFETEDDTENIEYFDFIFENTGNGWYWTQFPAIPE